MTLGNVAVSIRKLFLSGVPLGLFAKTICFTSIRLKFKGYCLLKFMKRLQFLYCSVSPFLKEAICYNNKLSNLPMFVRRFKFLLLQVGVHLAFVKVDGENIEDEDRL